MKVFIVYAHPEPKSFNGALLGKAVEVLGAAGHEVVVSDLYAMGWNPVSGRANFAGQKDPDYFNQIVEEAHATSADGFAPDIKAEQEKLARCDALILQFPLWWFSMPAIMKGWVDRVIASSKLYNVGRWYDDGAFKGKRAMISITTGGPPSIYSERGLNGHLDALLYPINHGILRFVGFDVLPPFVAYAAGFVDDATRKHYLEAYKDQLLAFEKTEPLSYPPLSAYDQSFQLEG